jgi:hypothetical protein
MRDLMRDGFLEHRVRQVLRAILKERDLTVREALNITDEYLAKEQEGFLVDYLTAADIVYTMKLEREQ